MKKGNNAMDRHTGQGRLTGILVALALTAAACVPGAPAGAPAAASPTKAPDYELWVIDQADTAPSGGGTLYIFRGADLAGDRAPAPAYTVNLAEAATGVGDGVGRRPHMALFNPAGTHAVIANVATGHVYVMRASDRKIVASIKMTAGAGGAAQAHAAMVSPKGDSIIVANQNGKKLQRIAADFGAETYRLDGAADLDLNAVQDADHPDNAPICPVFTADGRFAMATMRGGGAYLVDHTVTPMKVVASVGKAAIGPNGCGGIAQGGDLWLNSGGGTPAAPTAYKLYHVPAASLPGTFTVHEVHSKTGNVDAHGAVLAGGGKYLWMTDRFANTIEVFEAKFPATETVRTINIASGPLAGKDPAADLVDSSPDGSLVFASLRGKEPLTANVPQVHNAVGDSPGIAVIRVLDGGRSGEVKLHIPLALAGGASAVDPHALRVRVLPR